MSEFDRIIEELFEKTWRLEREVVYWGDMSTIALEIAEFNGRDVSIHSSIGSTDKFESLPSSDDNPEKLSIRLSGDYTNVGGDIIEWSNPHFPVSENVTWIDVSQWAARRKKEVERACPNYESRQWTFVFRSLLLERVIREYFNYGYVESDKLLIDVTDDPDTWPTEILRAALIDINQRLDSVVNFYIGKGFKYEGANDQLGLLAKKAGVLGSPGLPYADGKALGNVISKRERNRQEKKTTELPDKSNSVGQ